MHNHFCKSFEVFIKIVGCGWCLTVNVVICPPHDGLLLCWWAWWLVVKLAKLGWNKIESQNTFFHFSYIDWTLKITFKTPVPFLFHEKWFPTTVGNFAIVLNHYIDVIMTTIASQITSLAVVYSIVYSDVDQRKHQSSASLAFVRGIHRDRWIPRTKGQ